MDSFTDDHNSPLPKQMQSETMDDGRPSSLPANDRAAPNARRVEGRPAMALRALSERLERVTLKHGTVAIASKVASSEDPFRNLSDEILEHILARLSRFPLKAAKKVCKRWASVTSTPEFDILHKKLNPRPHLLQYGISHACPSKSQCFEYDVENNAWVTLPALQLSAHIYGSVKGASGVVFAVSGPGQDRLLYKLTSSASSAESFGETWSETPVMTFPRATPVVSVALGASMGHKVVVAGGGSSVRDAHRAGHKAVEVFDSEIGTWESYGDLPKELWDCDSWFRMSGVVLDNKFYVLPVYRKIVDLDNKFYVSPVYRKIVERELHFLDFSTKQWASVQLEFPMDLISSNIMAIGTALVVGGLCKGKSSGEYAVKLWKVDLKTLSLIQIGLLMPSELATFLDTYLSSVPTLRFLVDEDLVLVVVDEWRLIMAKVSLEECQTYWRCLPLITSPLPSFVEFVTFFASSA